MENYRKAGDDRSGVGVLMADETGAVLLPTLVILLLVTMIGISGINTSSTDLQITRNYRIQKQNLALADAAINRAKSLLAYNVANNSDTWVNDITDLYAETDGDKYFKDGTSWEGVGGGTTTPVLNEINVPAVIADWDSGITAINPTTLPGEPNTQFVVYRDPNSTVGIAVVIARSFKSGGDVIIEAGIDGN